MTTRGTKVLLSLLAVATLGFSMVNAYTFFVENRNPFGALNLTKLIIKASPEEQTGMELSNFKLQINTSGGQLNVHKICDENGENCRDVDVLYTWTQGNQWPQWNTWAHVVTWYVNWDDIVFGLSDGSTITLADVIPQISSTWPQWDTWAQWDTWVSIVSWYINENDIVFELSNDSTITLAGIIQTITWPQGNTWASWTWIHHINTWYENWITTVEIYTDEDTIAATFQIRDWADWGTQSNIDNIVRTIFEEFRRQNRKPNALNQSGYVIGPTQNQTGLVWKTDGAGNPGWRPDETSSIKITPGAEQEICVQWVDTINCNTVALWKPENFVNNKYCIFDSNKQIVCNADWTEWESLNIVWSPDQRCKYQCVRQPSLSLTWKCDWDDSDVCNAAHTEYSNNLNCTDETDDTNCIRYYLRIKDNMTRFTDVVYDDWDCSIICDQAEPTCQGQCEWWSTDIEWNPFGRCRYMCSSYKVDGLNDGNWQNNSFSNMQALLQHINESLNNDDFWKPKNIERTWCKIKCNAPEPSWWWSWDGLWRKIENTNTIQPTWDHTNVVINWGRFKANPENDPELYKNIPEFIVETWGIRMFGWVPYFRTISTSTDSQRMRWLSVRWPILAWNSGNYISMFADWDWPDDPNRSYEIMWEHELAVGTRNWSFLYFTRTTGSYSDIPMEYSVGPSTINWTQTQSSQCNFDYGIGGSSIIVKTDWVTEKEEGTDEEGSPKRGNESEWSTVTLWGLFWWLPWWDICTTTNAFLPYWHERHSQTKPTNVQDQDVYETLMVGVNTDRPRATLDINWSIRLWNNCFPISTTCSVEIAGTMMYLERKDTYFWSLVICMANGIREWHHPATGDPTTIVIYERYDITRWIYLWSDLITADNWFAVTDWSCDIPRPNQHTFYTAIDESSIPAER